VSDFKATVSDAVMLSAPVVRGEQKIESVQIRKPKSGELRGLSLHDLLKFDVDCCRQVLPRVTMPPLLAHEIDELDPSDLIALAGELGNFFLPAGMRPESQPA